MGTKIVLGLTGAAIGFMAYVLFHFVQEGRQHPRTRPVVTIAVVGHSPKEHERHSKAA
jgi:hypothetical protein